MAKQEQPCPDRSCGHDRSQHSKDGCTWPGCACKLTYMEVGEANR